ncbi:MAG: acyltransferase [Actinomycetes bacterium]
MGLFSKLIFELRVRRAASDKVVTFYDLNAVGTNVTVRGRPGFGSEPYLITIGSDVRISSGVKFFTHDGGAHVLRTEHADLNHFARIEIGDRVFIGAESLILPGVTIGSDVVIGAGSVVSRDIPDSTVAAGVPCKPLGSIDSYRERMLAKSAPLSSSLKGPERKAAILKAVTDRENRDPADG